MDDFRAGDRVFVLSGSAAVTVVGVRRDRISGAALAILDGPVLRTPAAEYWFHTDGDVRCPVAWLRRAPASSREG